MKRMKRISLLLDPIMNFSVTTVDKKFDEKEME